MANQTKNSMLLMLCALIWGTAFVAQSAGSGMGAFSFLAGRSWMAVLVLIPMACQPHTPYAALRGSLYPAAGENSAQRAAGCHSPLGHGKSAHAGHG